MKFRYRSRADMREWLRTHVRIDGDCRIWAGTVDASGMPLVCWMPHGKRLRARRVLLELLGRTVPAGAIIWSNCGNPACMTPSHLLVGMRRDMVAWMTAEGRMCRGVPRALASASGRPNALLSMRNARAVAQAQAEGQTQAQIAAQYGVHQSAVGHAIKRWRKAGVI